MQLRTTWWWSSALTVRYVPKLCTRLLALCLQLLQLRNRLLSLSLTISNLVTHLHTCSQYDALKLCTVHPQAWPTTHYAICMLMPNFETVITQENVKNMSPTTKTLGPSLITYWVTGAYRVWVRSGRLIAMIIIRGSWKLDNFHGRYVYRLLLSGA